MIFLISYFTQGFNFICPFGILHVRVITDSYNKREEAERPQVCNEKRYCSEREKRC